MKASRSGRYVLSAAALLVAIVANQWTLAWLLHRRLHEISVTTKQNLFVVELLLVLFAVLWPRHEEVRAWWSGPKGRALRLWFTPPRLPAGMGLALAILAIPSLTLNILGFSREDVPLWHPVALLAGTESALFSALLMVAVYWTVLRFTGRRVLASLALVPWVAFNATDLVGVWIAGLRFEPRMTGWSSTASVAALLTPAVIALILAPIVVGALALPRLKLLPSGIDWMSLRRLWIAVLVVGVLQPAYLIYRVASAPIPVRYLIRSHSIWADTAKYRPDAVMHALEVVLVQPPYRVVEELSSEQRALSQTIGIAPSQGGMPLAVSPKFRRVMFLTCESLGMNFIGRYNPAMPVSPTPFLDSLPESFLNFWACSFPTNAGLATHYCSHPNYGMLMANRYPNSFVKQLSADGWRTALFRSADLSYSSGERRFTEIGFRELFGAEWQASQGRGKYISGWGTCDRISLESAVDYLKAHRNERVFVSVMPADMHMPTGRADYGDLVYPEAPAWIKGHSHQSVLTAIWRFDHDLSRFFAALKKEGLWDESTLLVITADHAFPAMRGLDNIPGVNLEYYQRIPFIVVSGQTLPQVDHMRLATQTATAPTFAALLGLPVQPGWWGKNLFAADYAAPVFVATEGRSVAIEPEIDPRLNDEANVAAARAMFHVLETRAQEKSETRPSDKSN